MSHLDCVDQLRETIARVSEAQARRLNTGLELLTQARGQSKEKGKGILKEMIITADVFSRVLRETLTVIQRDEIVRQIAVTYNFPRKDSRLIGAIVDHWLAYDRSKICEGRFQSLEMSAPITSSRISFDS